MKEGSEQRLKWTRSVLESFALNPPPCVHAWHVVGLLNLAVKKTHAKRKPLELQYPECFMEGS